MDSVHHIAFQVDDIAAAIDWYSRTFEVETAYRDESWALLTFENISLALVLPGQHPLHIAVEKPDAKRFGPLTPHRDATASAYVNDRFGNAVEILTTE